MDAADVVTRYFERVNATDVKGALELLSDDFELTFLPGGYSMSKANMESSLGWDAGAGGRMEWTVTQSQPHTVVVEGREINRFLELLGVPGLDFVSTFRINDEGLISRQEYQLDPSTPSIDHVMKPLVEWASKHEEDELAAIYPEGQIVYSREMAERWVELARRWRSQTSQRQSR